MALVYALALFLVGLGIYLYGSWREREALLERQIETLTVERDSAELRYRRAKATVVRDTVVVRQTITRWRDQTASVQRLVESLPEVEAAQVEGLIGAGNLLAAQCAEFLTHTEALVASADSLNLADQALVHALGKRGPSRVLQTVKGTLLILAGIGLGQIL